MEWLHWVAVVSLVVSLACAAWLGVDVLRRPQPMGVMNVVWPVTGLYGGPLAVWLYMAKGRAQPRQEQGGHEMHMHSDGDMQGETGPPSFAETSVATSHCGAGCTLADIGVETLLFATGATLLGSTLWASYLYDFLGAWLLGVAFQYFSIQPMRKLPVAQAIAAAIKADTLSIVAFQVGMYVWMGLAQGVLFVGRPLHANSPVYWFMMQVAMLLGFATAWPMNRWLVAKGWKERM